MRNEQLGISQLNANLNKGWTWDDWQKNAPEGIEAMEKHRPDLFNTLYNAEYGNLPGEKSFINSSANQLGISQLNANLNKGWTWDDWQKNAPEGIEAMEKHQPELFNALYRAEFGNLPGEKSYVNSNNEHQGTSQLNANLNKGWTWDEWQNNAPEGIEAMEKQRPDLFNALYKAKYEVIEDNRSYSNSSTENLPPIIAASNPIRTPSVVETRSDKSENIDELEFDKQVYNAFGLTQGDYNRGHRLPGHQIAEYKRDPEGYNARYISRMKGG